MVLCWPRTMQNLSAKTARIVHAVAAVLIATVSLVRVQYMVEDLDALQPLSAAFKRAWQPIYVGLSIFGDMVLPVLLMVSMIFFSIKIIIVVVKRRRDKSTRVHPDHPRMSIHLHNIKSASSRHEPTQLGVPQAVGQRHMSIVGLINPDEDPEFAASLQQAKNEKNADDANSVVSLVMILDVFFILNQIGYCFYAVSEVWKARCDECPFGMDLYITATFVSDFLECLSRSLHFYFYVRFSHLLRQEFLEVMSRVRKLFLLMKHG